MIGLFYINFQRPDSVRYSYGFNGEEKVDEIYSSSGASYDFGNRMYDARVAKFLSTDRFESRFPYQSPYCFASNTPIMGTDINGDSLYILIVAKGDGYNSQMQAE